MSTDVENLIRTRLDAHTRTAPPPPALGDLVGRCEDDLIRHRRRMAAGAAGLVAAVVVAGVAIPTLVGGDPRGAEVANDGRPLSDARLIEVCREGSQPAYWTDLVFGPGTPRVAARTEPGAADSTTILVSADGAYWARCFNAEDAYANTPGALDDEPGRSSLMVFESAESDYLPPFTAGGTCPRARFEGCERFRIDYADRLPAEVAAVEFTTIDGVVSRVATTDDGFVVLGYDGVTPPEVRGRARFTGWFTKIVYLGADGQPLAGNALESRYRLTAEIDGLPPLNDYPSLARPVVDGRPPAGDE